MENDLIAAIHQPQYLPWLGYFDKMRRADAFCYLDTVQYKKNEWQNRNRIKTSQGCQWLTVPVTYRFPQAIRDVEINNRVNWNRQHLQAIITNYRKTPYFEKYFELFEELLCRQWSSLSELNVALIRLIRKMLGLDHRPFVSSSKMELSNNPTDRLIDICLELGADTYLSGADGANYMNLSRFKERGVNVIFQQFNHPVYPQPFGEFQSHMSILDLLFNCGPESMDVISQANNNGVLK
jgi:hypothetical protein